MIDRFNFSKMKNVFSVKAAFVNFASISEYIEPAKCSTFVSFLLPQLTTIFSKPDPVLMVGVINLYDFNIIFRK